MTAINTGTKVHPVPLTFRSGDQSGKRPGGEQPPSSTRKEEVDPEAAGAFLRHLAANLERSTEIDLSKEAATLLAANAKQHLKGITLGIANQRPNAILALFAQKDTSA